MRWWSIEKWERGWGQGDGKRVDGSTISRESSDSRHSCSEATEGDKITVNKKRKWHVLCLSHIKHETAWNM